MFNKKEKKPAKLKAVESKTTKKEIVEETKVEVVAPIKEAPKKSKFIAGKFVENKPVLSATPVNGIMVVKTTVAGYKMSEEDYNNL